MSKRIYTPESVAIVAKQFRTRTEFSKKASGAYDYAWRHKLLDSICQHMAISPRYSTQRWSKETAFAEARNFTLKERFHEKASGALQYLKRNGWLEEACAHMDKPLTKEKVLATAKRYSSRTAFMREQPGCRLHATTRGYLDEACAHMPVKKRDDYSEAAVRLLAEKCATRREFLAADKGAYVWATRKGLIPSMCAHMKRVKGARFCWDLKSATEEAKKYATRSQFRKFSNGAHSWALKNGVLEDIYALIPALRMSWTKEAVMTEALKYQYRSEFLRHAAGGYSFAKTNGLLEEVCAHMRPAPIGFRDDKPGCLYFLEVHLVDGGILHKIGISNRDASRRVKDMGTGECRSVHILKVIKFTRGYEARKAEQAIKTRFAPYRYSGPPVLLNGNTELFIGLTPEQFVA